MIEFNGQAVIVTGAGRGLGRLYALDLAQRGASVLVNDVGVTMHGDGVGFERRRPSRDGDHRPRRYCGGFARLGGQREGRSGNR